jgi:hypothetical protein
LVFCGYPVALQVFTRVPEKLAGRIYRRAWNCLYVKIEEIMRSLFRACQQILLFTHD